MAVVARKAEVEVEKAVAAFAVASVSLELVVELHGAYERGLAHTVLLYAVAAFV